MPTKESLKTKIDDYRKQVKDLHGEAEQADRQRLRVFRKRLKRAQRKLVSLIREQERLAGQDAKKKSGAKQS